MQAWGGGGLKSQKTLQFVTIREGNFRNFVGVLYFLLKTILLNNANRCNLQI